jgi:hypothetical protein
LHRCFFLNHSIISREPTVRPSITVGYPTIVTSAQAAPLFIGRNPELIFFQTKHQPTKENVITRGTAFAGRTTKAIAGRALCQAGSGQGRATSQVMTTSRTGRTAQLWHSQYHRLVSLPYSSQPGKSLATRRDVTTRE